MFRWITFLLFITASAYGNEVLEAGHSPGKWTHDYQAALKYARENKKAVLLNFTGSDWCGWCKLMDKQVFSKDEWKTYAAKNVVQVWIDFPQNKSLVPQKYVNQNNELKQKYNVRGFPTYMLLGSDGQTVLGKLGAGRDKTPATFAAEVAGLIKSAKIANVEIPVSFGVSAKEIEDINKKLVDFAASDKSPEKIKAIFDDLLAFLKKDSVNFTFISKEALSSFLPHCSEENLNTLVTEAKKTLANGCPIDNFLSAVDELSKSINGNLDLNYKIIIAYSLLNSSNKIPDILPDIEVLKKINTLKEADPWLKLIKQFSPKNYLEMCFALQEKPLPTEDKVKMATEIAALCSKADSEFMTKWFKSINSDSKLLEPLKKNLNEKIKQALKSQVFRSREEILASHIKLVNSFSEIKPEAELSRIALRHWGLEYANGLANYRKNKKGGFDPRTRRNVQPVIKSIDFDNLILNLPSEKTLQVLSKQENELFRFQKNVATVKTGNYNEQALDILISFKEKYPETVSKYCSDFFIDWAQNVNPNKTLQRNANNAGTVYYYQRSGMNYIQEPVGIPLTRSRQIKNLKDCSAMFKKVSDAGISVKPQEQISAFISIFSQAEIITEDEIRMVFDDMSSVTDDMMIKMTDHVISLIKNNWMNKKAMQQIQTQFRTNRSEEESMAEISKAYRGIINIIAERLKNNPENIGLSVRLASIYYDIAEFEYENKLCTLEEYTELRDNAFSRFEDCAKLYEKMLEKGTVEYTAILYTRWFSVILGASDLNTLEVNNPVSNVHLDKVKNSLFGLQEKWRERHVEMFGNWVSSQWSSLNPNVKLNFIESAKEVIGKHESILEIDKQLELYKSFLSEIHLSAKVDGSTDIGEKEFGLLLSIRHTPELEREASGFGKYVQDQVISQSQRTPIDYRKNFAKNINKALKDKFDVNGMTWMDGSVKSQESTLKGWRETPLVYVKLRAKDNSVDKIPSIQLDMDFNDGSGKVVLPVLSNVELVNGMKASERPTENVEMELVLDARGANDGKISLEVKVTGEGMLPNLAEMLKPSAGYTFTGLKEASPVILRLDQVDKSVIPKSELATDLKLDWKGKLEKFTFPELLTDNVTVTYKQYKDADIVPAEKTVYIHNASAKNTLYYGIAAGIVLVLIIVAFSIRKTETADSNVNSGEFQLPETISAVSVLKFLHKISHSSHPVAGNEELRKDIERIEKTFFANSSDSDKPDLQQVANNWMAKVS